MFEFIYINCLKVWKEYVICLDMDGEEWKESVEKRKVGRRVMKEEYRTHGVETGTYGSFDEAFCEN